MSVSMPRTMTRGVVYVHSTPKALCPHILWAIEGVLGTRVTVDWTDQPAEPGLVRAELSWSGQAGTGARIASALRGWDKLRFTGAVPTGSRIHARNRVKSIERLPKGTRFTLEQNVHVVGQERPAVVYELVFIYQ